MSKHASLRASASNIATSIWGWVKNPFGNSSEDSENLPEKHDDNSQKSKGKTLFAGTVGVAATGAVIVAVFTDPVPVFFGQELSFTWLWIWASAAYIGSSFRWKDPIQPDQIAVRTSFGRPIDIVGPGLPFVPLGIFELQKMPGTVIQREFPAEPEKIFHGDGDIPLGMKPPIRIPFGESIRDKEGEEADTAANAIFGKDFAVVDVHKIYDVDWSTKTYSELDEIEAMERKKEPETDRKLLHFISQVPDDGISQRVTANVVPYAVWQIKDAIAFVKNVTPLETPETQGLTETEKQIAEVNKRIEDEMVSVLTRLLQKMSFGQALNNADWINAHLYFAVIKRTLGWGIKVDSATVKLFGTPKRINEAIANAAAAKFQGNADRELAIKQGQGAAHAARDLEEQTLIGRAAGQQEIATRLGLTGEQVQAAEVARSVAEGGNTVIIGQEGFGQLAGIVGAMVNKKPTSGQTEGNK